MTVITGEERDRYVAVLADWPFVNIVVWEKDDLRKLDEFLPDYSPQFVSELLYEHAASGGEVHRKNEDRDPWKDEWKFHYDVILPIAGKAFYVETRFDERKRDWPKVLIVHIHPPGKHFK
ncbi:MAG TPA: hypothetical protein VNH11_31195 [Pirellulales bacterium]|nr:hypothetical protein [Pirellulales bacterium]